MEISDITSVKIKGTGYLLNGTMSVPKADGNREYELIKEWLSQGNVPEEEFTQEELAQQVINAKVQDAREYLISTGWYVERLNDPSSGKAVPKEVLDKRAEARAIINELEG